MVTGYNINFTHDGVVYHVQTEDRGRKHPVIETLIYFGGTIIHRVVNSYADDNTDEKYDARVIKILLDQQHERLIELIKTGALDPNRRAFGEEHLTDRTLDECVWDFLKEQAETEKLGLSVVKTSLFSPGAKGSIIVRASNVESDEAVAGAIVRSHLVFSDRGPDPLPEVETDAEGKAELEFDVPTEATTNAALIIHGESDIGHHEIHKVIC